MHYNKKGTGDKMGRFYGIITSEGQLMDIATIHGGCDQVVAAAEKFVTCANHVQSAGDICNARALSIDSTTMQPQLQSDADFIKHIKTDVKGQMDALKGMADGVYAEQRADLAQWQEDQRRKAEAEAAAKKKNS